MPVKKVWKLIEGTTYIYIYMCVCVCVCVFISQWPGKPGFSAWLSHTKDTEMVLDADLLNTHLYKVRIMCKVEPSSEKSRALFYPPV